MRKISRRNFLGLVGKLGGVAALAGAPVGCATLSRGIRFLAGPDTEAPVEIMLKKFQEYNPSNATAVIDFPDDMLGDYVTKPFDAYSLGTMIFNPHLATLNPFTGKNDPSIDENPMTSINIENYDRFKEVILETSQEIGYTKQQLSSLSVHDAVMLSGRLLAQRLEYAMEMISEADALPDDPLEAISRMFNEAANGIDSRNDLAKSIDNASEDQIFINGQGICRNYAEVNVAVFQLLKDMNPNLKNTYMRVNDPVSVAHLLALPHAWNMVSTLSNDDLGYKLEVTFVDPTWLDTRNKTANNSGAVDIKVSEEDIYNALDEDHYLTNQCLADVGLASLYQVLGKKERTFDPKNYSASVDVVERYRDLYFDQLMDIGGKIMDVVKEDPAVIKNLDFFLGEAYIDSVHHTLGYHVSHFMEHGDIMRRKLSQKQVGQLHRVLDMYKRAVETAGEFVRNEEICSISGGYCPSKVTMQQVHTKLVDEFSGLL
jgi:hypothetical protein